MARRLRVLIRGLVQGVGFRYFAARKAEAFQISGWVRNTPEGAVEALLEGPSQTLEDFLMELRQGPRHAQVESVEILRDEPDIAQQLTGFQIRQ